jgi:hypothetical protein
MTLKPQKDFIDFLFKTLKESPVLLMNEGSYGLQDYITFFEGYFLGVKMFTGIDLERQLSDWFQVRVNEKAPNMYWFAQFKWINEDKNEAEKIEALIDTIELFFRGTFC